MENIIDISEYRKRIDALTSVSGFGKADVEFLTEIENIKKDLKNAIMANEETPEIKGTAYYVSPKGNDANDGLSPDSAWLTLNRVNTTALNPDDAILFERGGLWRGSIDAQTGITYAAYGKGAKPKICTAFDGMIDGKWCLTEKENVWMYDLEINDSDIGLVLFNDGECYSDKKRSVSELEKDLDFVFTGSYANDEPEGFSRRANMIYLYSEKNPAERFWQIDFSMNSHSINHIKDDVTVYNIDFSCGGDIFFEDVDTPKNVVVKYCALRFMGGHLTGKGGIRFRSGGGVWRGCNNMRFEACYFYEQFDAGLSPQYNGGYEGLRTHFYKFIVTDCIMEKTEWPFEYWIGFNGDGEASQSLFEDTHFSYNICIDTGNGFGKRSDHRSGIKCWEYPTPSKNCSIDHNIIDWNDPNGVCVETISIDSDKKYHDELLFKLEKNIYIAEQGDKLIEANGVIYCAEEEDFNRLIEKGVEIGPVVKIR